MKIFKLPDLGEGLPDAVIRKWYVKVGDQVTIDQPLVAMETAKALVDVPSPYAGKIEKLFGNPGDTIETGNPLVGFEGEEELETKEKRDTGTVVGTIEENETVLQEPPTGIVSRKAQPPIERIKATPAVRALAKKLGVDLTQIKQRGTRITAEDVRAATEHKQPIGKVENTTKPQPLDAVRRTMVLSMTKSHAEVVPVTLVDDADIHAWSTDQDVTLRVLRAMVAACQEVPMLNVHFLSEQEAYQPFTEINIGVAVDTPHGLYVPVLKDVAHQNDKMLRRRINQFKKQAQEKTITQEDLHGATITLTNFGSLAGRYANPIILPPMVAIIGIGRIRKEVVAVDNKFEMHRMLPLSVTIDHRIVTGGEAARFLKSLIDTLEK